MATVIPATLIGCAVLIVMMPTGSALLGVVGGEGDLVSLGGEGGSVGSVGVDLPLLGEVTVDLSPGSTTVDPAMVLAGDDVRVSGVLSDTTGVASGAASLTCTLLHPDGTLEHACSSPATIVQQVPVAGGTLAYVVSLVAPSDPGRYVVTVRPSGAPASSGTFQVLPPVSTPGSGTNTAQDGSAAAGPQPTSPPDGSEGWSWATWAAIIGSVLAAGLMAGLGVALVRSRRALRASANTKPVAS